MKNLTAKNYQIYFYLAGSLVAFIVSLQSYLLPHKSYDGTREYSRYNNYVIFKNSFNHLKDNQNLYVLYETEHWDLYKYSPTFSLMMAPFWYMPDLAGLFLWNLLNVLVLFFALAKIHFGSFKMKLLAHVFILPEVFTCMQNSQSNLLIAGLMILGFVYVRQGKLFTAVLMVVLAAFIKPFALAAFVVFIFFPGKFRMVGFGAITTSILFFAPIVLVSFSDLIDQYKNWYVMLQQDHSMSFGYSVLGWLNTWFGMSPDKLMVLMVGLVLLLVPLLRFNLYGHQKFWLYTLSSVLIWVILFNHKSESPTFIIAVAGIAIWFFTQPNPGWLNTVLVILAFVFTCLIASDIFPQFIRKDYAEPYVWKVVPCIVVWIKVVVDLMRMKNTQALSDGRPV